MNRDVPQTPYIDTDWQDYAACKGMGNDVFFPEESHNSSSTIYNKALSICRGCPVSRQCLMYAMYWEEGQFRRFGVFGGLTPRQRDQLCYGAQ